MLGTYNYYPEGTATVTHHDDGTATLAVRERFTREHVKGRHKGTVEQVVLRLHFASLDDLRSFLTPKEAA